MRKGKSDDFSLSDGEDRFLGVDEFHAQIRKIFCKKFVSALRSDILHEFRVCKIGKVIS